LQVRRFTRTQEGRRGARPTHRRGGRPQRIGTRVDAGEPDGAGGDPESVQVQRLEPGQAERDPEGLEGLGGAV